MPSQEQITWAKGLIEAFQEHQQLGKVESKLINYLILLLYTFLCIQGAFTYQGRMIDKPLLLQAENIVSLYNTISAATEPAS